MKCADVLVVDGLEWIRVSHYCSNCKNEYLRGKTERCKCNTCEERPFLVKYPFSRWVYCGESCFPFEQESEAKK